MPLSHSRKTWQENHERLYQAALREIERVGFNDVRVERICEETKLSRPTFYAHFSNKDSIVSELLRRFVDGIARELEARTRGSLDLEAVIDVLVTTVSRPQLHDLRAAAPRAGRVPSRATTSSSCCRRLSVYTVLTRAIVRAAQLREIQPVPDPRALARQITVVINGFFPAHPNEPEQAAREARELLKLVLQGLRARSQPAQNV